MKRRTIIINSVLAAAVLVVAGLAWAAFGHSTAQAATSTGTVGQGTVLATSTASGTVIAPDDVGLNFGSSGTITSVRVKVGEKVSKGEVLATIDTTSADEQLAQAQAQLAQAELTLYNEENGISSSGSSGSGGSGTSTSSGSTNTGSTSSATASSNDQAVTEAARNVDQAEATLSAALTQATSSKTPVPVQLTVSITKAISSLGAASQSLQSAKGSSTGTSQSNQTSVQASSTTSSDSSTVSTEQIDVAEANVTAAKAQVATAETALAATTITAPAAGTVASISGTVGEQVSGGSSSSASGGSSTGGSNSTTSSSSEPSGFIVLTGVGQLEVTASFSEADTTDIKVGAGAKVTFPALSGVDLNGNVLSIASYPTTSSGLTTYAVTLSLVNPPATLKVGQSASISVITAEADNTLFVPSSAVSSLGGINTVTVIDNGTRTVKTVTIGVQGDSTTQIESGLTKGETVVLTSSSSGSTSAFPTGGIPRGVTGGGLGGTTTFGGAATGGRG